MIDTYNTVQVAQAGAIPTRMSKSGIEILLVTRRCGGWTIPKGCVDLGHSTVQTARTEALEEAGVDGPLMPNVMGHYDLRKDGIHMRVAVHLMEVERVYPTFAEDRSRIRGWFAIEDACRLVGHPELAKLLRLAERVARD